MAQLTIGMGASFIIIGIVGYITTYMQSWTALIPAFLGIIFIILGGIALRESARKIAMHIAMVLGLVGLIYSFPGLIKLFPLLTGADFSNLVDAITKTMISILLIYYLGMGIKSFIDARKKNNINIP